MDYGLRYKGIVASQYGHRFFVHLLEEAYSGAVTTVKMTDKPIGLTWGRRGVSPYTPILASHAQCEFWRLSGTLDLIELAGAKPGRYRLEIHREAGAGPYWKGAVQTDVYSESTMSEPIRLAVAAVDGLGLLKKVPYRVGKIIDPPPYTRRRLPRTHPDYPGPITIDPPPYEAVVPYQGRVPIVDIVARCLGKLGFGLPFTCAVGWRPFQSAAQTSRALFEGLTIDQRTFYDEDWTPKSCYEVLRQIAYRFGAQIFQQGGTWHILQRELMLEGATYTRHVYEIGEDDAGEAVAVPQRTEQAGGFASTTSRKRLRGNRTFREAKTHASVEYNHGDLPSLIDGGDFVPQPGQDTGDGPRSSRVHRGEPTEKDPESRYWDLIDGSGRGAGKSAYITPITQISRQRRNRTGGRNTRGSTSGSSSQDFTAQRNYKLVCEAFFHGGTEDPAVVKARAVTDGPRVFQRGYEAEPDQVLLFTADLEIVGNKLESSSNWQSYWYVRVGDHILTREGTWVETPGAPGDLIAEEVQYFTPPGNSWGDEGLQFDSPQTLEIVSEPHPTGGVVECALFATSDVEGDDLDPFAARWDNVALLIADLDGEVLPSRYIEASLSNEGEGRETIEMIIGDGPAKHVPGTMKWGVDEPGELNAPMTSGWKRTPYLRGEEPTETSIGQLLAETILRTRSQPLENRHETYELLGFEMGEACQINRQFYAPNYLSKDLYHAHDEAEWIALDFPEIEFDLFDEPRG